MSPTPTTTSTSRRRALGAAVLASALACTGLGTALPAASATSSGAPKGHVVLIGGALKMGNADSEAIMQRIVDLAQEHAGAGNTPKVAVFTVASTPAATPEEAADPDEDNATTNGVNYYQPWFESHGATVYNVPIDVNPGEDYPGDPYSADNAEDPAVAAEIASADAVYFGGGDQTNYVRALFDCTAQTPAAREIYAYTSCDDTLAMSAMRKVMRSGGVSAGVSAGLHIQQGADMVSGGYAYDAWRDGATAGWFADGSDRQNDLTYIPAGGFGFFSEGLLDSHFARRDRQPRTVRLALATGHDRSFGVEEKTALVVDRGARTGEVIGALGASLLDVSRATITGRNAAGIRYSYFTSGSTIDFATGKITLAGTVHSGLGTAAMPSLPAAQTDIWGSGACMDGIFGTLDLAQGFVQSKAKRASGDTCKVDQADPRFRTTFNRLSDTVWNDEGGFLGLDMSITEIPSATAHAKVTGPKAGKTGAKAHALKKGKKARITVTVKNTGGTALTGFTVTVRGKKVAASTALVQPGKSVKLTFTQRVAAGKRTVSAHVAAKAADAAGRDLRIDGATTTVRVTIRGR